MNVTDPSSETPETGTPEGAGEGLPNTASSTTDAQPVASSSDNETGAQPEGGKPEGEGAADATKPKSVFEAVKAAMSEKDKGAGSSPVDAKPNQPGQPEGGKDGQPAAKPEGVKPDDKAEIPQEFSKHPAWIRIAKDRDEKAAGAEQWTRFNELVGASGFGDAKSAEEWMNVGARWNKAGVTDQERFIMSELAIATKTDPARAFKIIEPIYNALRGINGDGELSPELKAQVDAGEMTEDAARRIQRSEAAGKIAERNATRTAEDAKRQSDERAAVAAEQAMADEVYAWEMGMAKTDPDWKRIAPLVNEQVGILKEARKPSTPAAARKVCEDAVAMVRKTMGVVTPPKPAVTPPSAAPSNRRQQERATTLLEHVKRNLAA